MNFTSRPIVAKRAEDFLVYSSLLPSIREKYGPSFDFLEIPEALGFDAQACQFGIVCVRYYDGKTYNWTEENGGAGLGTELSLHMIQLMQDFQRIDISWLLPHPNGNFMRPFDVQGWLQHFETTKRVPRS